MPAMACQVSPGLRLTRAASQARRLRGRFHRLVALLLSHYQRTVATHFSDARCVAVAHLLLLHLHTP
jgi:hypothetical protein